MGLFDWFFDILYSLGWYKKSGKLLFLGLDGAGKTCLLHLLMDKDHKLIQPLPSLHPSSEELVLDNIVFTAHDVGGHKQVRKLWSEFFPAVDAIVFIIDSHDRNRFEEAKAELDSLLSIEEILNVPFLILGNKIDKFGAAGEEEIKKYFNLNQVATGKHKKRLEFGVRPIEIFMCSLKNKEGYGEGFRWLSNFF